jgi:hypothetical protein
MARDDEFDQRRFDEDPDVPQPEAPPDARSATPELTERRAPLALSDVFLTPADVGPSSIWLPIRPPLLWLLTFEQLHQLIDRWLWSEDGSPLSREYMFFCANGLGFGRGPWAEARPELVDDGADTRLDWVLGDAFREDLGYWRPGFEGYLTVVPAAFPRTAVEPGPSDSKFITARRAHGSR